MTTTDVLEKFYILEGELFEEYEKEKSQGLRLTYLEFHRVICSMREVIRKVSRCNILEGEDK